MPGWASPAEEVAGRFGRELGRHELYDLENDRGERHDVAAQHAEIVRPMKADYAQWYGSTKTPMGWGEQNWKAPRE
jgi:hypothetical protein